MSSWQIPPNIASQAEQPPTNATSGTEKMETTYYESSSPDHKLIPPYLTPSSSSGGFPTETGRYGAHLPSPSTYGSLYFKYMPYVTPASSSSTFTTPPNTAGHSTSWPTESPNPNFVSGYDGRGFSVDEAAMYPAPSMARNNFDNLGSSATENPFGIYDVSEQFDPDRSNPTAIQQPYSSNLMYPSFTPLDLSDSFQAAETNVSIPQYQAVPPQQEDYITTTMPLQSNLTQRRYPITTPPGSSASFQTVLPPHQAVPSQQEDRTSATPSLLPAPSSHRILAPKRRMEEEGQEESASGTVPKRGRRTPPGPDFLNDKEQLLMDLKEGQELSWKQIAAQYSSSTGKRYSDAALQMKSRRVKERLQEWKDADSRALRLAIDDYLAKNNNEMPRGNRQWTIVLESMREYGSTYGWSAEMCRKKLKKMDKLQEVSSQQQPATSSAQPNQTLLQQQPATSSAQFDQTPQQATSTPSVSQYSSPETGAYYYYIPQ